MHPAAFDYVRARVIEHDLEHSARVLDLGGRNINGTTRALFPDAEYVSCDIVPGPDVDVVGNAATISVGRVDVVVSTELLEHTSEGAAIVANARRHLDAGGVFIATMAGPGRPVHSATGASHLEPGEWYRNIEPDELAHWLAEAGFGVSLIDMDGDDLRCIAFA
jgi:SAM-dependent methyltransferase